MGASALRRDFKARRDSSNEFISSSIACRRKLRGSTGRVPMKLTVRKSRPRRRTLTREMICQPSLVQRTSFTLDLPSTVMLTQSLVTKARSCRYYKLSEALKIECCDLSLGRMPKETLHKSLHQNMILSLLLYVRRGVFVSSCLTFCRRPLPVLGTARAKSQHRDHNLAKELNSTVPRFANAQIERLQRGARFYAFGKHVEHVAGVQGAEETVFYKRRAKRDFR